MDTIIYGSILAIVYRAIVSPPPTYSPLLCSQCQYDLQATLAAGKTTCPEYGHVIAAVGDEL